VGNAVVLAPPSPPRTLIPVRRELPAGYPVARGKKRAVLVGVSYTGTDYELRGTVNDVDSMKSLLCGKFGFPSNCILVLTGNPKNPFYNCDREVRTSDSDDGGRVCACARKEER
jgi:hypothetical protein